MKKDNNIKFETLRVIYTKPIVIGVVVFVVVMSTLILRGTMAKYQYKQSVKLAEGTINYKMPDFNLIALNVQDESGEYQSTSTVPTEGYTLNEEKSYCEKLETDGSKTTLSDVTIEYKSGELYFGKVTQTGTKCYVYFDTYVPTTTIPEIIASKTISTRTDLTTVLTTDTTGTIYSAEDDDGTTYYFAGAPTDNYVKFANFYWRIIRINGDGSMRLIYNGTSAIANGTSSTDTQISTSTFNSSSNNNMYVGFMYTSDSVHGLGTDSTIKGVLDDWYSSNLTSYASYIDTNAEFCGDRQPFTSTAGTTEGGGTGTTITYYGAYIRLVTNKTPSYKCTYSEDLYTVSSSTKGNKALTYPIGLITIDEVVYAGGRPYDYASSDNKVNTSFYLYTGSAYWTMSPYYFNGSYASVFVVYASGTPSYGYVNGTSFGVRPVINLKSSTEFTGDGTINSPYTPV